jgi:hypothetical protein
MTHLHTGRERTRPLRAFLPRENTAKSCAHRTHLAKRHLLPPPPSSLFPLYYC